MAKKIIKTHYVSVASDRFLWHGFLSGGHSGCKMALERAEKQFTMAVCALGKTMTQKTGCTTLFALGVGMEGKQRKRPAFVCRRGLE